MLTASRSLALNAEAGRELPRVDAFSALYSRGVRPRHGEVIMILGRSGTQKSGLALFWMAEMNLPTLYFSADMSAFTASVRLACTVTGDETEVVEAAMAEGGAAREKYLKALESLNITFSFGSPITWRQVEEELEAYVELHNAYPSCVVFDNLMDFEGGETDYTEQMATMQTITEFARETGASTFVLHHATDKSQEARTAPFDPPPRADAKNGLAEKPELTLGVGLDPNTLEYKIACLKQRMGPCDPSGRNFAVLQAEPSKTRFHKYMGMRTP
ncbi:AAA family ATPase [Kribbella sindirgiensis]|uniref:SF4 helicase domain-containing protein n=1 Tax=Kribbella sindirgiensis TaxID=1124744 RepID=A0A4R0I086_9ACTN|nr:AAA family ATPase [Kribbella sindirgiensis]TCC19978.1 hypothetical protein E0H50_37780 [Kribbella sindirgiensis]